eukprot:5680910-Pleurochrysis_carterae.AAC.2
MGWNGRYDCRVLATADGSYLEKHWDVFRGAASADPTQYHPAADGGAYAKVGARLSPSEAPTIYPNDNE